MDIRSSNFEALSVLKIISALEALGSQAPARLEVFDSIDSTNTYLLKQMKVLGLSSWVCFAEEQTAGRGRLGREWFSPKGRNLYCSLSWQFEEQDVSTLSLAVAVMIGNVLRQLNQNVQLKWPNDILFSGRKLAGILLERSGPFVVIGVGLNVELPKITDVDLAAKSIDLLEIIGGPLDRNGLAALLIKELLNQLPVYAEQGLSAFLENWRKQDVLMGRQVTVQLPDKMVIGEMQGITATGELILKDNAAKMHYFRCGEVTVRPK